MVEADISRVMDEAPAGVPASRESVGASLRDGRLDLWPHCLSTADADRLCSQLRTQLAWHQERLVLFGREHPVPRLVAWYGDPGTSYRYSGVLHEPLPWTGAQLVALLDQQWAGQPFARIMKPSGLRYAWKENGPGFADNRVDPASILVNGVPLDTGAPYSVTVNSFMAGGGDNFSVLTQGTDRVIGPVDLDALIAHIESLSQPFAAATEGRIATLP